MSTPIIARIKKEIENLNTATAPEEIGVVITVGDGIAEIEGLTNAEMMEMVIFESGEGASLAETIKSEKALVGLILNLEEDVVKVVVLGETKMVKEGMRVRRTGKLLSVPV